MPRIPSEREAELLALSARNRASWAAPHGRVIDTDCPATVQAWRDREAAQDQRAKADAERGPHSCATQGSDVASSSSTATPPAGASGKARPDGQPAKRAGPGRASTSVYPLVHLCREAGLAEPIPEYRFHPSRKWRFDYCWPLHKVALEVEGGAWTGGRHTRGSGFVADLAKYNAAALLGFYVLRYTPQQLGACIDDLRIALARAA